MAEALRKSGVPVLEIEGKRGEFTVSVDGQTVATKKGDSLPSVDEVLAAVKKSELAEVTG